MDEEGNLVKYIQGGDDEAEAEDVETEGEEVEDEAPVPYNYIEIYEEIMKDLEEAN